MALGVGVLALLVGALLAQAEAGQVELLALQPEVGEGVLVLLAELGLADLLVGGAGPIIQGWIGQAVGEARPAVQEQRKG